MSNVKSMRIISGLLAAAALAVAAAGCGETGAAGSADSVVPASALAYVSVDSSFEGDQWRAVSGLLEEVPDGEGLLEDLLEKATAEAGLEGDPDLRNALGPEVALVVLEVPTDPEADPPVVILTKPDDEDAFAQLFEGDADEPTGDLDRVTADEILGLLDRLNRELGKTIIMVTHDPKAAEKAHRVVHLEKGVLSG